MQAKTVYCKQCLASFRVWENCSGPFVCSYCSADELTKDRVRRTAARAKETARVCRDVLNLSPGSLVQVAPLYLLTRN